MIGHYRRTHCHLPSEPDVYQMVVNEDQDENFNQMNAGDQQDQDAIDETDHVEKNVTWSEHDLKIEYPDLGSNEQEVLETPSQSAKEIENSKRNVKSAVKILQVAVTKLR